MRMYVPYNGPGKPCRQCGAVLTIFHNCPRLELKEAVEDLAIGGAEIQRDGVEVEWAEIRRRFPLTAERIIKAMKEVNSERVGQAATGGAEQTP